MTAAFTTIKARCAPAQARPAVIVRASKPQQGPMVAASTLAALVLMATPAQAESFTKSIRPDANVRETAGDNLIEGLIKNVEKSMPKDRDEALSVPEEEAGALKFKDKGPGDLSSRFQSGGSGGIGPSAGKPMPR